jgi:ABC-2 type transport system permease protein
MNKYLIAENLKTKRTMLRKILIFMPILCTILSFTFDFLGFGYFTADSVFTSINHWSLLWMPALIALTTSMFHKLEQNSTGYKTIFSFPIDLKKSWISKIILLSSFTLISSIFLCVILTILNMIFTRTQINSVPFYYCLIAAIIGWLTSLWQIPLCLWLSKKINLFVLLLGTCAANMELGATCAPSSLWWLSPWAFPLRLQCPILHHHPNGLPLEPGSSLLNPSVISVGILIGIFLFLILITFTTYSFKKSEVH